MAVAGTGRAVPFIMVVLEINLVTLGQRLAPALLVLTGKVKGRYPKGPVTGRSSRGTTPLAATSGGEHVTVPVWIIGGK